MRINVNQIGYRPEDVKTAVLNTKSKRDLEMFSLIDSVSGQVVYEDTIEYAGEVANWNRGFFYKIDFTSFTEEGRFYLKVGDAVSFPFEIRACILDFEMMMNTVYYFRSQRDVGEWEAQDKNVMFQDQRPERVDASGGWFDATGDYGIHLSHLTHSKYYSPQQTSLSAYVFYKANDIKKLARTATQRLRRYPTRIF